MSCTCQQRRSVGGKMGCSACIGALNAAERKAGVVSTPAQKAVPPAVNKAVLTNKKPNT
jgi:hypothetical protein